MLTLLTTITFLTILILLTILSILTINITKTYPYTNCDIVALLLNTNKLNILIMGNSSKHQREKK